MSCQISPALRKKIIFLGTPEISAKVLEYIYQKANHILQIVAVVSQPDARTQRSHELIPSPVSQTAQAIGIPILTPLNAKDEDFLQTIEKLQPDLCLTAAYGQFLPKQFLDIPKYGTLNIHPSLLPCYRGASPVQRSIENGDLETGVTLLFSTLAMDAGPIWLQDKQFIDNTIKASELLEFLFLRGAELFVKNIRQIFTGTATCSEQDHTQATYAKKITKEEGCLDFHQSAKICHNKVRAFDIWPKTGANFLIGDKQKDIKIITTAVRQNQFGLKEKDVYINDTAQTIDICCGDLNILSIIELQEPGKRVMTAKEYINGLHGRKIICL